MKKHLEKIKGFSDAKVDKIKEAVKKCLVSIPMSNCRGLAIDFSKPNPTPFITGIEVLNKRKRVIKISTGSKQLDKILGGGFESQSISEVYGEYRCGKTQLCHTMCVIAQLPKDMGGAEGKAAYIDTEGTFRPERIIQIARRFGIDGDTALQNITYARCNNSEEQLELLEALGEQFVTGEFRLLIIDSVMACFRVDYIGRGELSERQARLGQFLSRITHIAEEFNVCVFMVGLTFLFVNISVLMIPDKSSPERSRSECALRRC